MEKTKICMGCFEELPDDATVCSICGFDNKTIKREVQKWCQGAVIEKRWLLGCRFSQSDTYTIWRAWDSVLEIKCFLLVLNDNSDMALSDIAVLSKENDIDFKILSAGIVLDRKVLCISADRTDIKEDEHCIKENVWGEKDIISHIDNGNTDKNDILPADTLLNDRYQILGIVGIGGFGITYLAKDINLLRNVAVKEYFPKQWVQREQNYVSIRHSGMVEPFRYGLKSFVSEIKMTAKFIHTENIVTVTDAFFENDTAYMVMEYIQGESIGRELRKRKNKLYDTQEIKEIFVPVLKALTNMHERKMIHCDISPANIIRKKNGEIVLIDMGAAKYIYDKKMTFTASFLKPDYAAPEQYQTAKSGKAGNEGTWTDIYAVGATMYHCLTLEKAPDVIKRLESGTDKIKVEHRFKLRDRKKWIKLACDCMELDRTKRIQESYTVLERIDELS